jgi:uncharacterized protein YjbI with pentapeptide repeats
MACRAINDAGIRAVLDFGILLFLLTQLTAYAQNEFIWKDASHNTRNLSDLEEILQKHRQWIESGKKSGTQADLSKTSLFKANLSNADLREANLSNANLNNANLSNADLRDANLSNATLVSADLSNARLARANLSDAHLVGNNLTNAKLARANLRHAVLHWANLSNADLSNANLSNAHLPGATLARALLYQADLSSAQFDGAELDGAVFEPNSLPQLAAMSRSKNLELLTYKDNPVALVQLRKQFEDGGFREQERKITYVLKRREAELSWERCTSGEIPKGPVRTTSRELPKDRARAIVWSSDSILANFASFILNKVFFDWTCQYGMSPGRPLILGVVIFFLCSLIYLACIHTSGEAGLYRVYSPSIHDDPSIQGRVTRISAPRIAHRRGLLWFVQLFRREFLLWRTSMFFSLMSAFNIGFRDINFGRWLRLLTRREFDIKAVGWARVVAGWQSLISVYLIALWVLTYFGRPFG